MPLMPQKCAGCGIAFSDPQTTRYLFGVAINIGEVTNNEAEYTGAVCGLALGYLINAKNVYLLLDSELVINQLLGKYRVKAEHLKSYYETVIYSVKVQTMFIKSLFNTCEPYHVVREKNTKADKLAYEATKLRNYKYNLIVN